MLYNRLQAHTYTLASCIQQSAHWSVALIVNVVLSLLHVAINCGDPGTPTNGQRSLSSTTYNSVVTYTCDVGYTLQGSNSRTCQSSGQWSGSVPQCQRKFIRFQILTFTDRIKINILICPGTQFCSSMFPFVIT